VCALSDELEKDLRCDLEARVGLEQPREHFFLLLAHEVASRILLPKYTEDVDKRFRGDDGLAGIVLMRVGVVLEYIV
jgi:hypothetical protein